MKAVNYRYVRIFTFVLLFADLKMNLLQKKEKSTKFNVKHMKKRACFQYSTI